MQKEEILLEKEEAEARKGVQEEAMKNAGDHQEEAGLRVVEGVQFIILPEGWMVRRKILTEDWTVQEGSINMDLGDKKENLPEGWKVTEMIMIKETVPEGWTVQRDMPEETENPLEEWKVRKCMTVGWKSLEETSETTETIPEGWKVQIEKDQETNLPEGWKLM